MLAEQNLQAKVYTCENSSGLRNHTRECRIRSSTGSKLAPEKAVDIMDERISSSRARMEDLILEGG
eukprot:9980552-Prorocentrum_lima.AAC.1